MRSIRFPGPAADGVPPLLLDGAMGTALLARGASAGDLPEAWLLERPEEVAAVHRGHVAAGAQLLLTCTFNAASQRLSALRRGGGPPRGAAPDPLVRQVCLAAARLARAESGGALVAGALGPLGLLTPGAAAPPGTDLARPFLPALQALVEGGVDLLWLETQYDRREAMAALAAARPLGLPVVLTYALRAQAGRLVAADGGPAEPLLLEAAAGGAAAVGVNCVPAGEPLTALARWACEALQIPFVVKPSPGLPGELLPPERFADQLEPAIAAGARLVGACCGSTDQHLAALARRLPRTSPG